jgi:hypothetical protein
LPGIYSADGRQDHQHGRIGIDGFYFPPGNAFLDDVAQPFAVVAPLVEEIGKIRLRQMPPFMIRNIDEFIAGPASSGYAAG